MSLAEMISPFLGRLALAWFFLSDAYMRALQWNGTIAWMAAKHIPAPAILLFVALSAMILGGLSLMLGFRAKVGALMLFAVHGGRRHVLLHNYWVIQDAAAAPGGLRNLHPQRGYRGRVAAGTGHWTRPFCGRQCQAARPHEH